MASTGRAVLSLLRQCASAAEASALPPSAKFPTLAAAAAAPPSPSQAPFSSSARTFAAACLSQILDANKSIQSQAFSSSSPAPSSSAAAAPAAEATAPPLADAFVGDDGFVECATYLQAKLGLSEADVEEILSKVALNAFRSTGEVRRAEHRARTFSYQTTLTAPPLSPLPFPLPVH